MIDFSFACVISLLFRVFCETITGKAVNCFSYFGLTTKFDTFGSPIRISSSMTFCKQALSSPLTVFIAAVAKSDLNSGDFKKFTLMSFKAAIYYGAILELIETGTTDCPLTAILSG